ncbi:hypothetical protein [Flavobacterium phage FL-1]|nr:hypothetical protein [Flavobacterium phage FL-1]
MQIQISLSKFKSATIDQGKRIIKVLTMGGAATAKEVAPFGIDSQPPPDMSAIYSETANKDEAVLLGYINKSQLAGPGEVRAYAVDGSGNVVSFLWLKNDGNLRLNGDQYNSVRFAPLDQGLANQDQQINTELLKIQTAITALGGTYTPATISTNIDNAESSTVKLK